MIAGNGELMGKMGAFYVVYHLRVNGSGKLDFWADDGCIISREGVIIHHDKRSHAPERNEIDVCKGDILQVAQWQNDGEWIWGARFASWGETRMPLGEGLWPYYEAALEKMRNPNGPPLKMYSNAATPVRTIVSVYSVILNGYVPSQVLLFGEHQWSEAVLDLLSSMLPFAEIISTNQLTNQIRTYGGSELVDRAMRYWWVLKTLISLLYPPEEFCAIDDDVFILDNTMDALEAFQKHDLVFATDFDHTEEYVSTWELAFGRSPLFETAKFNAGLYWMRNLHDPLMIADFALRVSPDRCIDYAWEQGFIANLFGDSNVKRLPSQRYFYPLIDGLPGGTLGYNYRDNPCGFASVHFGGLREKPDDAVSLALAPGILARRRSPLQMQQQYT